MTTIGWNILDKNSLAELLIALGDRLVYAVTQTETKSLFEDYKIVDGCIGSMSLTEIDRGRVFGPHCEARWIQRGGKNHVAVISDDAETFASAKPFLANGSDDVKELTCDGEARVVLWGERDLSATDENKFWFEGRIPQLLRYPVENIGNRVVLTVIEYCEKDNWTSKFYRFKEVHSAG